MGCGIPKLGNGEIEILIRHAKPPKKRQMPKPKCQNPNFKSMLNAKKLK